MDVVTAGEEGHKPGDLAGLDVRSQCNGKISDGADATSGDGTHKLPVTAPIRASIGKTDGDEVTIHLTQRLN